MEAIITLCDLLDMIFAEVQASHDEHCDGLSRLIEKGLIIRNSAGHWLLTEVGIEAVSIATMPPARPDQRHRLLPPASSIQSAETSCPATGMVLRCA